MVLSMARERSYLVSEVAEMAGVSVRTLHHYDEIELLVPRGRTDAGYRLYDDDDLLRLQQILLGRELGLTLEEIRRSLDEPSFDRRRALVAQRAELEKRAQHTQAMLHAIDAAIAVIDDADTVAEAKEPLDLRRIFDGFDPSKYEAEAEQRWGDNRRVQGAPSRQGQRATSRRRTWQNGIASCWNAGSTLAVLKCTGGSGPCTSRTAGSPKISTNTGRASRRFWRQPSARTPNVMARSVVRSVSRARSYCSLQR